MFGTHLIGDPCERNEELERDSLNWLIEGSEAQANGFNNWDDLKNNIQLVQINPSIPLQ